LAFIPPYPAPTGTGIGIAVKAVAVALKLGAFPDNIELACMCGYPEGG